MPLAEGKLLPSEILLREPMERLSEQARRRGSPSRQHPAGSSGAPSKPLPQAAEASPSGRRAARPGIQRPARFLPPLLLLPPLTSPFARYSEPPPLPPAAAGSSSLHPQSRRVGEQGHTLPGAAPGCCASCPKQSFASSSPGRPAPGGPT